MGWVDGWLDEVRWDRMEWNGMETQIVANGFCRRTTLEFLLGPSSLFLVPIQTSVGCVYVVLSCSLLFSPVQSCSVPFRFVFVLSCFVENG